MSDETARRLASLADDENWRAPVLAWVAFVVIFAPWVIGVAALIHEVWP